MNVESNKENAIEFLTGEKTATVSFTSRRYITKIRKLAESNPDECQIVAENSDGSICARVPVKWVKISVPRSVSEEQRRFAGERLRAFRENQERC